MVWFFVYVLCFYLTCRDLGGRIGEVTGCVDPYGDPAMTEGTMCSMGQKVIVRGKGKQWYPDAVGFTAQIVTGLDLHNDNGGLWLCTE